MAKDDTRLGKGLGALLGEDLDREEAPEGRVPVERIRPNPFQPRTEMETEALGELMESIRENGLLQPLVVRPADEGWELVAGERRWRALRKLGWRTAPVVVRELEDREMLVLALVENLQRESLSPIEEARGYRELQEGFGLTQKEVAERVGRDRSTVSNTLRLLSLEENVQDMVSSGQLSAGHARAILGLPEPEAQARLARKVVQEDLSVRETERRVRKLKEADGEGSGDGAGGRAAEAGSADPVARRAEQLLERVLGTEVSVALRGGASGRIGIAFHDAEEFERILGLLAGDEADELFGG